MLTLLFDHTSHKRIARVAGRTAADGVVVDDLAARVGAASPRARVPAALVQAGLVLRAFRADNALRAAGGRRPHVVDLARAHRVAVDGLAVAVGAAW